MTNSRWRAADTGTDPAIRSGHKRLAGSHRRQPDVRAGYGGWINRRVGRAAIRYRAKRDPVATAGRYPDRPGGEGLAAR